ncbi:MAG: LysR substrate-binding domain-containing protein [Myxococcota bacterium]
MELRHLRYFIAIAERSSFRASADALHVSQPTLSQQMKDLEEELGCKLFERAGRGVRLTQAGLLFVDYARRAMNVLDEGQAAVDEIDEMLRGRLRIASVQTAGAYLLPQAVARFHRDFPAVEVRVSELSAGEIETGLHDGALDLAVSFEPVGKRTLSCEVLFDEQFVLVVSKRHDFAGRKRIRLSELFETSLCLLTREYCTRHMIDDAFGKAGASPRIGLEMTSVEGCLRVADAGGPPTILPRLAVSGRKLDSIRIERPIIKRNVCLLQRRSQDVSRAGETFAGVIREAARSLA